MTPSCELRKAGKVVGETDKVYPVHGSTVLFAEILGKGDLSGELEYNGQQIEVTHAQAVIGLLVDEKGARGPIWQGVECRVLDKTTLTR